MSECWVTFEKTMPSFTTVGKTRGTIFFTSSNTSASCFWLPLFFLSGCVLIQDLHPSKGAYIITLRIWSVPIRRLSKNTPNAYYFGYKI